MKILFAILMLALVTACATPYYPVYVGDAGDYYIAETESVTYYDPYYGAAPGSLSYIGAYPWWEFSYYSPYFYPYHFTVWHPGWAYGYPGWHSAYYPYWCPPYRVNHPIRYGHGRVDNGIAANIDPTPPPVSSPVYSSGSPVTYRPRQELGPRSVVQRSSEPAVVLSAPTVGGTPRPYLYRTPGRPAQRSSGSAGMAYPGLSSRSSSRSGSSFSRSSTSSSMGTSSRSRSSSSVSATSYKQ